MKSTRVHWEFKKNIFSNYKLSPRNLDSRVRFNFASKRKKIIKVPDYDPLLEGCGFLAVFEGLLRRSNPGLNRGFPALVVSTCRTFCQRGIIRLLFCRLHTSISPGLFNPTTNAPFLRPTFVYTFSDLEFERMKVWTCADLCAVRRLSVPCFINGILTEPVYKYVCALFALLLYMGRIWCFLFLTMSVFGFWRIWRFFEILKFERLKSFWWMCDFFYWC